MRSGMEYRFWRRAVRQGQHFISAVRDQHGMLPLRRQAVILGYDGPAIGHLPYRRLPGIDHGLNRKNHASLKFQPCSGTAIVEHLRLFMELGANTMAAKLSHYAIAVTFGEALNGLTNVAQVFPRFDFIDAAPHALVGNFTQAPGL